MILNDSDNDNRVIPGRDPDWLSSEWPWIILQWQEEQWQQRDPESQAMGPRIIELIRSEVLTLFMFVDKSRDSRETRTHKLVSTKKDWQEYYRPGQSDETGISVYLGFINVQQFQCFSIFLATTTSCHRHSSHIQHSVFHILYNINCLIRWSENSRRCFLKYLSSHNCVRVMCYVMYRTLPFYRPIHCTLLYSVKNEYTNGQVGLTLEWSSVSGKIVEPF